MQKSLLLHEKGYKCVKTKGVHTDYKVIVTREKCYQNVKNMHTEERKIANVKATDQDRWGSNHESRTDPLKHHQLRIHHAPAPHHHLYLSEKVTLSLEYHTWTIINS